MLITENFSSAKQLCSYVSLRYTTRCCWRFKTAWLWRHLDWFVITYISEDLAASIVSRYILEGLGCGDWGYVYIYVTAHWLWLSEYLYLTMCYRKPRIWRVEVCDSICTYKQKSTKVYCSWEFLSCGILIEIMKLYQIHVVRIKMLLLRILLEKVDYLG